MVKRSSGGHGWWRALFLTLFAAELISGRQGPQETEWRIVRTAVEAKGAAERMFALRMLGRLRDPASARMLLDALQSMPPASAFDVAVALRKRASRAAFPEMRAAWKREATSSWSSHEGSIATRAMLLDAIARCGHEEAVDALTEALEDPEPRGRLFAVSALASLGKRGVPVLVKNAASSDPAVRLASARALAKMDRELGVSSLRRLLPDPDESVRTGAAVSLAELGLQDGNQQLRSVFRRDGAKNRAVLMALARLGDREARQILVSELSSQDPFRRARAAYEIGLAGLPEALPALRIAANDEIASVRCNAAVSLAALTGSRQPLLALLKDSDEWNRLTAAKLLLEQGDLSGRPVVLAALANTAGESAAVRIEAARYAHHFLGPEEAWRLKDLLQDLTVPLKLAAVEAAGEMRAEALLPDLKLILEEKREAGHDLTAAAAAAIARIGAPEALMILHDALKSDNQITRLCAAVELIRLRQERAETDRQ